MAIATPGSAPAALALRTARSLKNGAVLGLRDLAGVFGARRLPVRVAGRWRPVPLSYWRGFRLRYEPELAAVLCDDLRAGDTFYDVGAHHGIWSAFAASLVGQKGTVIAFEPSPAFERLSAGVSGLTTVEIHRWAVGDVDDQVTFHSQGDASTGSVCEDVTRINEPHHEACLGEETVAMVKLDSLVARGSRAPRLIKIDVEGFEQQVLEGAERLLSEHGPRLLMEIHPPQIELSGGSEEEIFRLLRDHGYSTEVIHRNPNSLYTIRCVRA